MPLAFCEATVRTEMIRWLPRLAALVDRAAAGLEAEGVARTARVFMVARSFSRRSTVRAEDFAPVVPLIARAVDGLTRDNLVSRVETLMRDMGAVPGLVRLTQDGRPYAVLSAASKFIWTAAPEVGIIIDQRARLCLSRAYPVGRSGSYGEFVHAARTEMLRHADFIETLVPHAPAELREAPWLRAKIFDFCLYAHGGPQ
ncbi:hypothetical protein [Methylobacterium radiotolerans]|uniref:hypothetical protein n=1 Tax=Methylobacterium radiotolerans TaxID=31998 RepID=UPI0011157ADC|nr:hypothetical protein [Methylobacterium radiotolerans]